MAKGNKGGRPPHEPNDDLRLIVMMAACLGRPHHEIAKLIKTGTRQLLKHYREELDTGKTQATIKVCGALYRSAVVDRQVAAQIFWLKAQAGWRETSIHEHAGVGGGAIQHAVTSAQVSEDDALKSYLQMVTVPGQTGHA